MNCRKFERDAADWLSRRLSSERSREMAAHEQRCPACARVAWAEVRTRAAWHDDAPSPPAADLWLPLARRLDTPDRAEAPAVLGMQGKPAPGRWKPRWALAAAIVLMTPGLCRWDSSLNRPVPDSTRAGRAPLGRPVPEGRPAVEADSWPGLSDVAQETALVDDPVGASTDTLWTYLKTDGG